MYCSLEEVVEKSKLFVAHDKKNMFAHLSFRSLENKCYFRRRIAFYKSLGTRSYALGWVKKNKRMFFSPGTPKNCL